MSDELMLSEGFEVQSAFRPFVMIYHDVLQALDVYQLAVYAHLVKYANSGRGAFPSTKTLADDVKISRRKVFYSLKELEGMGLIRRQSRFLDDDGKVYLDHRPGTRQISSLITVFDRVPPTVKGAPCASDAYTPMNEEHNPCASDSCTPMNEVHTRTILNNNYNQMNYNLGQIQDLTPGESSNDSGKSKKQRATYSPEFEAFWEIYPRKCQKSEAYGKFPKAVEHVGLERLLEATRRFAAYHKHFETQVRYIKHPKTWLNQKEYMDFMDEHSFREGGSREDRSRNFSKMLDRLVGDSVGMDERRGFGGS